GRADGGGVTDVEVALVGRGLVDDDLAGRLRGAAVGDPPGVDLGIGDPVAGLGGRAITPERITVGSHDLADAVDLRDGGADTVDRGDIIDGRGVEQSPLADLAVADLGAAAHHGG